MSGCGENRAKLDELRGQIDDLDNRILALLNRRMLLVRKIAALKHEVGKDPLDTSREQAIFRRLARESQGLLPWGAVKRIFGEILAASRDIQVQANQDSPDPNAPPGKRQ
jgi:chorismate mutase/prephenate dehydratase